LKHHRYFRPNLERGSNSEGKGSKHDNLCHGRIPSKAVPQPHFSKPPNWGLAILTGNIDLLLTGNYLGDTYR
jgi:hypothetical protein